MTASNVAMIDDFNPRSHEGSDCGSLAMWVFILISIHAPTRGATGNLYYCFGQKQNFNPRSHEGSD